MDLWEDRIVGNKRVARTKKAIVTALFEMMSEKEIDRITVTELASRAGVDRKTFYHYYKNVQDVIDELEDRIIGHIVNFMRQLREEEPDHRVRFFDVFNRILIERLDAINLLVKTGAMRLFWSKAGVAFKSELILLIEQDLQDWTEHDRAVLELGCLDIANGVVALYLSWFEDNRDLTLEELGRLAKAIAVGSLSGLSRTLGRDLQGLSEYIN